MKALIMIIPLLFPFQASAEVLTLIIERDNMGVREHMGIAFINGNVEYALNANFLKAQKDKVNLGHFRSKVTKQMKGYESIVRNYTDRYRKTVLEMQKMNQKIDSRPKPMELHKPKIMLAGMDVKRGSELYESLYPLFRSIWKAGNWEVIDAVRLTVDEKGKVSSAYQGKGEGKSKVPKTPSQCKLENKKFWACPVENWGVAYFKKD